MKPKKDNSTFLQKKRLRLSLLKEIEHPIVFETHGGTGKLYQACYSTIKTGVVCEKDPKKTGVLGKQRKHWFVYECDCISAIKHGVGGQIGINLFDLDPYGEPWPIIDTILGNDYYMPKILAIVVNDGLRQKLKMNGGWSVRSMEAVVKEFGNNYLYPNYLEICKHLIISKALDAGYALKRWTGYYCGHANQMTHYAAILER